MQIVAFLPPPPGSPESSSDGGPNTLLVLAIVALILGAVVLVAWLLKPFVAKRLRAYEPQAQSNGGTASTRWNESWSRNSETDGDEAETNLESPGLQLDDESDTDSGESVESSLLTEHVAKSTPDAIESSEDETEETPVADSQTADIVAISATVRTLLERANAGRIREGFALYSEAALERFLDDLGLSSEDFDSAFNEAQAVPPERQAELAAITDVERLPDGRIRALVSYSNGGTFPPPEQFTFIRSNGDEWLIDEIAAA